MGLLDIVGVRLLAGGLLLLALLLPGHAQADIYKCVKAGAVAYQETPCEGGNVQSTHIEDRDSDHFVGCFAAIDRQSEHYYEVRANGAGTYQLVDERNPLPCRLLFAKRRARGRGQRIAYQGNPWT